jgi:cytochrome P450
MGMASVEQSARPLPQSRSHPLRAPDGIAELAAEGLVRVRFPNGVDAWLAAKYDDVRMVLSDPRFSAYRNGDEPSRRNDPIVSMDVPANFNIKDGRDHQRYRLPLSRGFMVKRINQLRPRIQEIADEHLDAMQRHGPPAELVSALCLPLPTLVIAELLGVPAEHQRLFQRFATAMLGVTSTMEEFLAVSQEMGAVLTELLAQKRRDGTTTDLLGLLANDADPFPDDQLIFMGQGLLAAGHETTANLTGLAVLTLLERPEQRAVFIEHPENAAPAVDELLRFITPLGGTAGLPRRATEDVEVGGQLVRKGDWVAVTLFANYDEALCPHATELDLDRPTPPHLAFGFGPHQCLGQNLARAEMQIMLTGLFGRFPGLRLTKDVRELPFRHDMLVYGVYELPVTW